MLVSSRPAATVHRMRSSLGAPVAGRRALRDAVRRRREARPCVPRVADLMARFDTAIARAQAVTEGAQVLAERRAARVDAIRCTEEAVARVPRVTELVASVDATVRTRVDDVAEIAHRLAKRVTARFHASRRFIEARLRISSVAELMTIVDRP